MQKPFHVMVHNSQRVICRRCHYAMPNILGTALTLPSVICRHVGASLCRLPFFDVVRWMRFRVRPDCCHIYWVQIRRHVLLGWLLRVYDTKKALSADRMNNRTLSMRLSERRRNRFGPRGQRKRKKTPFNAFLVCVSTVVGLEELWHFNNN